MRAKQPPTRASAGKRQFLVHIDANVIRQIKILAIDRGVSASSLVQEALLAYLAALAGSLPHATEPGDMP